MNITDIALEPIVAKAIVDTLTPEAKSELIEKAIKDYITAPGGNNGYGKQLLSPLQQAFNEGIRNYIYSYVAKELESNTELKSKIERLFADAANKLFDDKNKYSEVTSKLADNMARAIVGDRY